MYNLLCDQLIDHDRDIYSVKFDLDKMREIPAEIDYSFIKSLPTICATVQDGFPNDHTIEHPAWATAIAIVTETKQDDRAVITEKTAKAILSESCWMLYSGSATIQVLDQLGFLSLFEQHASGWDIQPVLDICRQLPNPADAMDYRQGRLDLIKHNYQWLAQDGWLSCYVDKIKTDHDLL